MRRASLSPISSARRQPDRRPSPHTRRNSPIVALLLGCACVGESAAPRPPVPAEPVVSAAAPVAAAPAAIAAPEPLELTRALHRAKLTEVLLDPRGQAALTLDEDGGARLWPGLRAGVPTLPVVLPFVEATWISLAGAGERQFVVAALDTAGAARVGLVDHDDARARWRPLFELSPLQPSLEVHALDGGERLLRLGLDHSLDLYTRSGELLSRIHQPGFVPWQLRVAQLPGQGAKIVAVLADPVRVQPIGLAGDTLAIVGQARRVALDQGPNHNDLLLASDGSFVTALRRPRSEGRRWSLELIELATDARRWIAGEVDSTVRPRLHLVDAERALLESGTGKGFWVDLRLAVAPPAGTVVDRKALPLSPTRREPLPGSTEDSRMWSSVADGLRVVADGDGLIVDPLADDTAHRLAPKRFQPYRSAFAPTGTRMVWAADGDTIWTEDLADPQSPRRIAELHDPILALAMLDPERVLAADSRGAANILRWEDGAILSSLKLPGPPRNFYSAYQPLGVGVGELGFAPHRDREPVIVIAVDGDRLGERRETSVWPLHGRYPAGEVDRLREAVRASTGETIDRIDALAPAADRYYLGVSRPVGRLHEIGPDGVRSLALEFRRGGFRRLHPSPAVRRIAVVDQDAEEHLATVRVVDFTGDAPRVLWTRALRDRALLPVWSADAARLSVAGDGAWVFDATSGAVLHERRDLGLEVVPERAPARP